jgi:hypothetical protein
MRRLREPVVSPGAEEKGPRDQLFSADRERRHGVSDRSERRADSRREGEVAGLVLVFRDVTDCGEEKRP